VHRLTVSYFEPTNAAAFEAAYRERHVPLVQAVPGLQRLTLTKPRGDDAAALVAELWFADADAFAAAMAGPEMTAAAEDAETYDVARRTMQTGDVEEV